MNGAKLKDLRERNGLLQKELADILGVSLSSISMYERNERQPDNETLKRIAHYFEVSTDYLLDNKNTNNKVETIEEFKKLLIATGAITNEDQITNQEMEQIIEFISKNRNLFKVK